LCNNSLKLIALIVRKQHNQQVDCIEVNIIRLICK